MTEKIIKEYNIVQHGAENSQYFQGHGLFHSRFTDTATGSGATETEAFDDALEQLAMNGWKISPALEAERDTMGTDDSGDSIEDCDPEDVDDFWFYVSVDVR